MDAKRLEKYRQRLHSKTPLSDGWRRHKAITQLVSADLPKAAWVLEEAVVRIQKCWQWLCSETPLISGWLRRKAVMQLMRDGSPEAIRVMEEAAACNSDEQMQVEIVTALRLLTEQSNVEAQESLCRLVIFNDLLPAREAALAAQCVPRDAHQRALFYFLTEQWEKYESLDFDQCFLRTAYGTGDERLRGRIAQQARQAGRVEWIEVITGGRQKRRLGEMKDEEWVMVLDVLSASRLWKEMWRLAQVGPPRWSAKCLQRLRESNWWPDLEGERVGYKELVDRAMKWTMKWTKSGLRLPIRCLATLEAKTTEEPYFPYHVLKAEECCLIFSSDGQMLASGSRNNIVRLWSVPDGTPLKTLQLPRYSAHIKCPAISLNGQMLADGGGYDTVQLWSLPDGTPLKTLQGHTDSVTHLAISPDGRVLASGGWDKTVRLWRLPDGKPLKTLRNSPSIMGCLVFSPDGQILARGSGDIVRLWRLPDGKPLIALQGPKGENDLFDCVAISPDGQVLASGGWGTGIVQLSRLPDGKPLIALKGHTNKLTCLAISSDGQVLVSGSRDSTVLLWRLPDGAPLKTLEGHSMRVTCLAISPDGQALAIGSADSTVQLWTSELFCLSRLPADKMRLEKLEHVQELLLDGEMTEAERQSLEFIAALMRWQRRFDIEVGDAPRRIEVGEFDIEIGG